MLSYLPEETCFQQAGSSAVESTSQAVLGSSHQPKVPASLSLFLKSEKIPALLYLGVTVCNTQVLNGYYKLLTKNPTLKANFQRESSLKQK